LRDIHVSQITDAVAKIAAESNIDLPQDVARALEAGREKEESPLGREVLDQILENARIAAQERVPICQDTGVAVIFVELGQDVHITGGHLQTAIDEGVRRGYGGAYLRASMVGDPIRRKNTGDNTPAVVHVEVVPGDRLKLTIAPKGAGSENMSALRMLKPAEGVEGLKQFVVEQVMKAGSNPCPPIVVGVGLGGTMEKAAILAKKALVRPLGQPNPDEEAARLEKELLALVNDTGVGPGGFGGRFTAMAVHVEIFPCHIASLPAAVNIQCHAARHKEAVL
jgi:fumarate hydratase subunit alpha